MVAAAILFTSAASRAATVLPGWQAVFSTLAHDVSGTVTVVDADTFTVDDFIYDGTGLDVYFYLGEDNTHASFMVGLEVGPQLVGPPFDGTEGQLMIDLPIGETFDGYGAISVWCTDVPISFGSGTFAPVPEPSAPLLVGFAALVFLHTRRK